MLTFCTIFVKFLTCCLHSPAAWKALSRELHKQLLLWKAKIFDCIVLSIYLNLDNDNTHIFYTSVVSNYTLTKIRQCHIWLSNQYLCVQVSSIHHNIVNTYHVALADGSRRHVQNVTNLAKCVKIMKFYDDIWNRHEKCIRTSTNMPGIGLAMIEITFEIFNILSICMP